MLCGIYSVRVLGISAFSFISQQNTQRHIDNMGNGQLDIFNSSADTQNTQTHLQQIDSGHLKKSPERSADFVKKQGECVIHMNYVLFMCCLCSCVYLFVVFDCFFVCLLHLIVWFPFLTALILQKSDPEYCCDKVFKEWAITIQSKVNRVVE